MAAIECYPKNSTFKPRGKTTTSSHSVPFASVFYTMFLKKNQLPQFLILIKKNPQFSYFLFIPLSFRANSISNCITVPKNIFFIVWQKVYPDVICQLVLPIFTIQINFHAQFIIEVQDMLQLPPDEEIAKKYTQFALKYAKYREIKEFTFSQLLEQIATMSLTSIIAHQTMYLLTPTHKQTSFLDFIKHTSFNIQAIRRPTQHTITVFSLKIIIDFFNKKSLLPYDEYKIGAAVGLCSYFLGRPIDQLDTARRQIFANEKKHISRLEAINVVVRHDGFKGFYKHENLLGPICNTMYRAVYFGLWARLLNQYGKKNRLVEYISIPFVASLGASLSTAIPDKLRSFCLQINDAKSKTLQKRNKKLAIEIPPTFKLMFEHLISPHFKFTKTDLTAISMAVVRNWIILGCFAYGQDYLQKYQKTQKQSKKQ